MQRTGIQYLTHTWNPIAMRCTRVSPGCQNCWHLSVADRLSENLNLPLDEREALAGTGRFIIRLREMDAPLRLKKPAFIGVQFMGDLFHKDVRIGFIKSAWEIMGKCPQHIFLVLTKRAHRLPEIGHWLYRQESKNIWLGVTVCNDSELWKVAELLKIPAAVRWVSIEPMLGPVDLLYPTFNGADSLSAMTGLNWVVLGGETGPGARPMYPDWPIWIKDQCQAGGVPFFFKNHGSYFKLGKASSRLLEGREWNELPMIKGDLHV
jgi:protein gp37